MCYNTCVDLYILIHKEFFTLLLEMGGSANKAILCE